LPGGNRQNLPGGLAWFLSSVEARGFPLAPLCAEDGSRKWKRRTSHDVRRSMILNPRPRAFTLLPSRAFISRGGEPSHSAGGAQRAIFAGSVRGWIFCGAWLEAHSGRSSALGLPTSLACASARGGARATISPVACRRTVAVCVPSALRALRAPGHVQYHAARVARLIRRGRARRFESRLSRGFPLR